ncbi:hypothetical protein PROFUN_06429 [Planoprotostelium fungivorum]|uniref:Pentatricopeptide repeat-containing protein n=1 Tax=Planoprotostelium fungivorum TaxID=1890364 RepID=A0A2P6MQ96_9EUKA|nr:hypothetical protein PROFUN_16542 [Planoprotostelium fungivorum]PRP85640.1 hypothetical protein PROFUN_06429 [Planoprotostelium fungivorum]
MQHVTKRIPSCIRLHPSFAKAQQKRCISSDSLLPPLVLNSTVTRGNLESQLLHLRFDRSGVARQKGVASAPLFITSDAHDAIEIHETEEMPISSLLPARSTVHMEYVKLEPVNNTVIFSRFLDSENDPIPEEIDPKKKGKRAEEEPDEARRKMCRIYPLHDIPSELKEKFTEKSKDLRVVYSQIIYHFMQTDQPYLMNFWQSAYERDFHHFSAPNHITFLLYNIRKKNKDGVLYWLNRIIDSEQDLSSHVKSRLRAEPTLLEELLTFIGQGEKHLDGVQTIIHSAMMNQIKVSPKFFEILVRQTSDTDTLSRIVDMIITFSLKVNLRDGQANRVLRRLCKGSEPRIIHAWLNHMSKNNVMDPDSITMVVHSATSAKGDVQQTVKFCKRLLEGGTKLRVVDIGLLLLAVVHKDDELCWKGFCNLWFQSQSRTSAVYNRILRCLLQLGRKNTFVWWWRNASQMGITHNSTSQDMKEQFAYTLKSRYERTSFLSMLNEYEGRKK